MREMGSTGLERKCHRRREMQDVGIANKRREGGSGNAGRVDKLR